jgi:hypothetical protein
LGLGGANLNRSPSLDCRKREKRYIEWIPLQTRAWGAGGHWCAPRILASEYPTHLTRHKIGHLSNGKTVRVADVFAGRFCYTGKCLLINGAGTLWLGHSKDLSDGPESHKNLPLSQL